MCPAEVVPLSAHAEPADPAGPPVSVVIPTSGDAEDLRLVSSPLHAAVHEHGTGRADLLRADTATPTADPDEDGPTGDGGRIQTA